MQGDEATLDDERLEKHREWIKELQSAYNSKYDVHKFILEETGKVFSNVLNDAGVFKMNEQGNIAFEDFIKQIIKSV